MKRNAREKKLKIPLLKNQLNQTTHTHHAKGKEKPPAKRGREVKPGMKWSVK